MKKKFIIILAALFLTEAAFCKEFKPSPFYKPVYKAATESFFKVGDIVVDENNNPIAVIFKGNKFARDTALGVAIVQKEDLEWALADAAGYAEKVHAMIEDKTSGKNGHLNAVSFYNEFEKWGDDIENYPAWAYAKNYNEGGLGDWFIPSIEEFNLLMEESEKVNSALNYINAPLFLDKTYWTSNVAKVNSENAFYLNFKKGKTVAVPKSEKKYVCLIREFNISNENKGN